MFCSSCGTEIPVQAKFCGKCGAKQPERTEAAPAIDETQVLSWTCPSCGSGEPPATKFCGNCGAARPTGMLTVAQPASPVPLPAMTPPPPVLPPQPSYHATPPPPGGTGKSWYERVPVIIGLVLVVVLLALAAAYVAFSQSSTSSGGSGGSAGDDPAGQAVSQVTPAHNQAKQDLDSLKPTKSSFKNLHADAISLQQAVATANTQALAVNDATERQRLAAALDAEKAWAQALADLSYADASAASVSRAKTAAQGADLAWSAYATAGGGTVAVATVAESTGGISNVVSRIVEGRKLRGFLVQMENLMSQSAQGRSEVVSTIAGVNNDCQTNPSDGAQQLDTVAQNRQSLLDQVSAMNVPPIGKAQHIHSLFQQALQSSIEADHAFSAWMQGVFNYYYTFPQGCYGTVPHDSNYNTAESDSAAASSAKAQLVVLFNRAARRFGLKANWSESDI